MGCILLPKHAATYDPNNITFYTPTSTTDWAQIFTELDLFQFHIRHSLTPKALQHSVFSSNDLWDVINCETYTTLNTAPCKGLQGAVAQYAANQKHRP